ncbi:MAG: tetratricopeptide repeat protein [Clostridia bacterium]|nr:tetratricopeptide repeat protein [Clostridia bacterium]
METAKAEKNYEVITIGALVTDIKDAKASDSDEGFCFVIGAGASVPSGIPSGKQLVSQWEKEIAERCGDSELERWKTEKGITEENKHSYYSDYYEKRYKQPREGYKFLEKKMMDKSPSMGYVALSHIMCESKNNIVITTNFDHLIEDAVNYYQNKFPLVIGHEAVAHYIATAGNRPTIIKIHHDLLMDPKNNKASINELAKEWREPLSDIFKKKHPVFVGYAGNDKSLMDFLNENAEKFQSGEWLTPYWLFYTGSGSMELSDTARSFLNNARGYLANYANFDMAMMLLAHQFGFRIDKVRKKIKDGAKQKDDMMAQAAEQFERMNIEPGGWDGNVSTVGVLPKADASEKGDKESEAAVAADKELDDRYVEAVMYFNNGEYESAREILQSLVEIEPNNAKFHNDLSYTLDELGRRDEALLESKKAGELEPDNVEYRGHILDELGHHDEALIERRKAVDIEPNNPRCHHDLGTTLYNLQRYDEALEEEQKAIELSPTNAKYHYWRGSMLMKIERYEEALFEAEKAIEFAPNNDKYLCFASLVLEKLIYNHYSSSSKSGDFNVCNEKHSNDGKQIELELGDAEKYYDSGLKLWNLRKYNEALKAFEKAEKLADESTRYYNGLGFYLNSLEHDDEAIDNFERASKYEHDGIRYRLGIGITLYNLGCDNEASEKFKEAEKISTNEAVYRDILGVTLNDFHYCYETLDGKVEIASNGVNDISKVADRSEHEASEGSASEKVDASEKNDSESEDAFEKAADMGADDAYKNEPASECEDDAYREETPSEREEAVREAETASEREDDFSEAAEAAAAPEAVSGYTDEPLPHGVKADAQFDGFSEEFYRAQMAVDSEPETAEHHYNLAVVLGKLGFHKKALKEYKQAIMLSPRVAKYHNAIGITLEKLGRSDVALKAVQRAAELEPDNAEYNYGLSLMLRKLSQPQDALAAARAAVVLAPENAKYHCGLSVILAELDDIRGAKDEAEKAVELKPNDREYVRWLESLEYKLNAE